MALTRLDVARKFSRWDFSYHGCTSPVSVTTPSFTEIPRSKPSKEGKLDAEQRIAATGDHEAPDLGLTVQTLTTQLARESGVAASDGV